MSLSFLSAAFSGGVTYKVVGPSVSSSIQGVTGVGNPGKTTSLVFGTGPNKANELYVNVVVIGAGESATIDLTNVVNPAGEAVSFSTVQGLYLQLLSESDDSTNGTNCSSVTVFAANADAFQAFLTGTAQSVKLSNGDFIAWATQTAGVAIQSNSKNLFIQNNDSVNIAAVAVVVAGLGT
jgi:hypothetical protein